MDVAGVGLQAEGEGCGVGRAGVRLHEGGGKKCGGCGVGVAGVGMCADSIA